MVKYLFNGYILPLKLKIITQCHNTIKSDILESYILVGDIKPVLKAVI